MRSYRARVAPMVVLCLLGWVPTLLLLLGRDVIRGMPHVALKAAGMTFLTMPVVSLVAWLLTWIPMARVGDGGIWAWPALGLPRTVAWSEITRTAPVHIVGVRYIRVYSARGGAPLWVPTWLADAGGFARHVEECAGAENPLAQALSPGRQPRASA